MLFTLFKFYQGFATLPLLDSWSFDRDPFHLTLNHSLLIIRLSRPEEIAETQLSRAPREPLSGLVTTGFEPVIFCFPPPPILLNQFIISNSKLTLNTLNFGCASFC